jgi:hypothetical protein
MGSKGKIINIIAKYLPKAKHFYDLFGGGFSVTHYMLLYKFKNYEFFHWNEINTLNANLIKRAINGDFNYIVFKPEFITRDIFEKKKDLDGYIKYIWSFGNNGKSYIFGKDIEQYKKSLHNAIIFDDFDELSIKTLGFAVWPKQLDNIYKRRLYLRKKIEFYRQHGIPEILKQYLSLQQLERLQQLEQLQQLERLQQLEQLEQLQQLELTTLDYRKIKIEKNSVIYCDPPYRGTARYGDVEFNHNEFYEWAIQQNVPVFISEYDIPDKRFKLVTEIHTRSIMSNASQKKISEKLYSNGK